MYCVKLAIFCIYSLKISFSFVAIKRKRNLHKEKENTLLKAGYGGIYRLRALSKITRIIVNPKLKKACATSINIDVANNKKACFLSFLSPFLFFLYLAIKERKETA